MATTKTLSRFGIETKGEGFSLHIEDDAGEVIEFDATAEQIDLIVEALDDLLDEDDSLDEVED
jgi:hypothetical protein